MKEIGVVITFSSRTGATEKLALAAALGAVQAKAKIRLRWLPEDVDDPTIAGTPGWRENRDRMTREYIAPREIDLLWADVLILGIPARDGLASPELKKYLAALEPLQASGKLVGKVATAFSASAEDDALISLCSVFEGLALTLVPPYPATTAKPLDTARLHGRRLVEAARNASTEPPKAAP
jgi:multimeric flavodoxin WrbA